VQFSPNDGHIHCYCAWAPSYPKGPYALCCLCGNLNYVGDRLPKHVDRTASYSHLLKCFKGKVRSQKAQGLRVLSTMAGVNVPQPIYLIQEEKDIAGLPPTAAGPWFARPCPVRPRPGFVESRAVKTAEDLLQVYRETRSAERSGEVLLMPTIAAAYNIAICPGQMAIGPGHDGATAGKNAIAVPLADGLPPSLNKPALLKDLRIAQDDTVHVEAVVDKQEKHGVWWTQARSGPAHAASMGKDFIPTAVKVTAVETPCDDLLEWEKKVQQFPKGTAVYGPGSTLCSHAALHCIGAGIPFLTTRPPKVGESLVPVALAWDQEAIREGVGWALSVRPSMETIRPYIYLILYGLHHSPAMQGSDGFWLGAAAGLMLRAGMSAGMIELKIHNANMLPKPWTGKNDYYGGITYAAFWNRPAALGVWWQFLPRMTARFMAEQEDNGQGGIGGPAWGRCCYATLKLGTALQTVLRAFSAEDLGDAVGKLILSLNLAVDMAHNGGWWLNKFGVGQQDFQDASMGEWSPIMEAAPLIYSVDRGREKKRDAALRWASVFRKLPSYTWQDVFLPELKEKKVVLRGTAANGSTAIARPALQAAVQVEIEKKGTEVRIFQVDVEGKRLGSPIWVFEMELDRRWSPAKRAEKAAAVAEATAA
jgi:hypothetical protein